MIRYHITYEDLISKIKKESPTWMEETAKRTENFRHFGEYREKSDIWGRVKTVYMNLQHNKCAFCERELEGPKSGGAYEGDIDHFRPKNPVKTWPTPKIKEQFHLPDDFPVSTGSDKGYYLLAYHPFNYVVACKPCNSYFKKNYFPIGGSRNFEKADPRELSSEKAYLVYPIGDFDADPESIIKYDGVAAVPVENKGENYDRARVIIIFFNLNDREACIRERIQKICHLFHCLEELYKTSDDSRLDLARLLINNLTSEQSPHTNCIRSFKRLYENNRDRAIRIVEEIKNYLKTIS